MAQIPIKHPPAKWKMVMMQHYAMHADSVYYMQIISNTGHWSIFRFAGVNGYKLKIIKRKQNFGWVPSETPVSKAKNAPEHWTASNLPFEGGPAWTLGPEHLLKIYRQPFLAKCAIHSTAGAELTTAPLYSWDPNSFCTTYKRWDPNSERSNPPSPFSSSLFGRTTAHYGTFTARDTQPTGILTAL